MTRKQETINIICGIGLLLIALALLALNSVPSDPKAGQEVQFAAFKLSITALSFVLGSAAMALFIAARNSAVGLPLRSPRQSAFLGFVLLLVPICAVAALIEQIRTSNLIALVLLIPFLAWLGGGYLFLALRCLRRKGF